jgi:hypothetical protein
MLRENQNLLERMTNVVKYSEKQDLPNNPYAKPRPTLEEYLVSVGPETKSYDLDEYGIKTLANAI